MRMTGFLAAFAVAASLAVPPVQAGSDGAGDKPLSEELDQIFQGMIDQMKPALDEFLDALEVLESIDSIKHYERPEVLPNGDIIIRRRGDAPPLPEPDGDEPESEPDEART